MSLHKSIDLASLQRCLGTAGLSGDTMILVGDKKGLHIYNGDGDFIKSKRPKCGGTIYGVGMCLDRFKSFMSFEYKLN